MTGRRYGDLTLFSVCVVVNDDVTELYGVVDSESDNDEVEKRNRARKLLNTN